MRGKVDIEREVEELRKSLERWCHGEPHEGDYICPAAMELSVVPKENQETICTWQEQTFGPTTARLAFERMQDEYWELRDKVHPLTSDESGLATAAEECADVLITLYRVAEMLGCDLHAEVDRKMAINRARTWVVDEKGHGKHV